MAILEIENNEDGEVVREKLNAIRLIVNALPTTYVNQTDFNDSQELQDDRIDTLELSLNDVNSDQATQNSRLDNLEAATGALTTGVSWKNPCVAASTSNEPLLVGYFDWDDRPYVDGLLTDINKRYLFKDQDLPEQNGIYQLIYDGSSSYFTRTADFSGSAKISGAIIPIEEGDDNADTQWICTSDDPITIDTTQLEFTKAPTNYTGTSGEIVVVGNRIGLAPEIIGAINSLNSTTNSLVNTIDAWANHKLTAKAISFTNIADLGTGSIPVAALTIDGESITDTDYFVAAGQTDALENGLWQRVHDGGGNMEYARYAHPITLSLIQVTGGNACKNTVWKIGVDNIFYRIDSNPIIAAASITAQLNATYSNIANITYADPTPVNGLGYIVEVFAGIATVGGVAYNIKGTIVKRVYEGGAWNSYVYLERNIGVTVIYIDFTTGAPLTGTTAITMINSALIPANTVKVNDEIQILAKAQRNTATGNSTGYLYFNTSQTLSGATLLGTSSTSASGYIPIQRHMFVKSATDTETLLATFAQSTDLGQNAAATISNLNINWSNDVYIIQAHANAATGNITTSRGIIIKRSRI